MPLFQIYTCSEISLMSYIIFYLQLMRKLEGMTFLFVIFCRLVIFFNPGKVHSHHRKLESYIISHPWSYKYLCLFISSSKQAHHKFIQLLEV